VIDDHDGAADTLGQVNDDGREGGLVHSGNRIGAGRQGRPGIEHEQGDLVLNAHIAQPGDMGGIQEVEPRANQEANRPGRGASRPRGEDVIAAALQS
jgi:hypothetical protein